MSEYFTEDFISPYGKKYKVKLAVFFVFLGILSLLIYFAFFGGFSFTGSVVNENVDGVRIKFDAKLTKIPVLELNGEFESVRIKGVSDSSLYVGDQKFPLGDLSENYIVLNNYNGKIYFNENNISKFNGKVEEVIINGVSLAPKLGKITKIYFDEAFDYSLLEVKETVFIKKLSYVTSGEISLYDGKNFFGINNEEIIVKNFQGDLKVDRGDFNLEGYLEKLEVVGDSDISVGV